MVTRIDRLARSIGDLQDIVRTVRARGAALKATEQPPPPANASSTCWGCSPSSRPLEGIAKAKVVGVYKGTARFDRRRNAYAS
jgi:hypothetical protein